MSRLFPFRSPAEIQDESPRVLSLSGDEADDVFAALSSGTARALLAALYDEPRPTSELADELGTSIQNARYHLGNLQDAGLVEVVDTWYSEQGNEMKVYAPTNGALVLFEGQPESRTTLRDAVTRLLGGVGVLALAALLIDRGTDLFRGLVPSMGSSGGGADGGEGGDGGAGGGGANGGDGATTTAGDGGGGGGDGDGAGDGGDVGDGGDAGTMTETTSSEPTETTAEATQTATQTTADGTTTAATQTSPEPTTVETTVAATETYTTEATETTVQATQTTVEATRTAAPTTEPATTTVVTTAPPGTFEAVTGVPLTPGLAFFLGGLVVLLAGFAWWYRARGPLG